MARASLRVFSIALIASMLFIAVGIAPAQAGPEGSFVKKVNSARKSAGKAPVQVYWDLTDDARRHARNMAKKHQVFPNPNIGSATSGWKAITEVNGAGPTVNVLFDAFMSSYRSTILGSYNYIGVGVVIDESDIMWVSMIFMRGPDGLVDDPDPEPTTTTTKPPSTTTTAAPTPTTTTSPPATTTTSLSAAAPTTTSAPEPVAASTEPNPDRLALTPPTTTLPPVTTTTAAEVASPAPSSTTTTVAALPEGGDAARQAAIPPAEDDGGSLIGVWAIFGIVGLAGAGMLLMTQRPNGATEAAAAGPAASAASAFDPCTNCGLVFSRAKADVCPRCGTSV